MTPEQAQAMALPFPVLSDVELVAAKKYGLIHEKGYMFQDVARPTTLIIGGDGRVRWMRASDHVRTRPAVDEIFEELRK